MCSGRSDLERFWSKVPYRPLDPAACWFWCGATDGRGGYGKFKVDGVSVRAIRWIYEAEIGPLGADQVVGHTCDKPSCVRPSHLVAMTHAENMRDKAAKRRVVNVPRFLTVETVSLIKFASSLGASPASIATQLGLKYTTVRAVTEGRRWKHIE